MALVEFIRERIAEDENLSPTDKQRRLEAVNTAAAWSEQRRPDQLDAGDEVLRFIALLWRDHQDYRDEWRL